MKLHLPLSLRSALLAVLALSSFSYAADVLQAEGGNIPDNPNQGNKPIYYVWATNILTQLRNAASANDGYIYDTITFTLNDNLTREMNEDICFAGLVTLNLNGGIFNHKEGSFGRNADAVFNIAGGTYNMVDASSSAISTPEIGFGYGYTVTINLTGGNFVMNNMTAYIAREGAHAEITVGSGSTFTLQNGSIGYGTTRVADEEQEGKYISKGSSVNLTVENGGKLVMSGGRIGSMTGSAVENHITIKSGGSFSMSGGAIGDTAHMVLTVESGGTWILTDGNFTDSRGTIHLAGTGVSGNAIDQGGNAALFVNGSVSTAISMAVALDSDTTFNVYNPQDSVSFSGQYSFGGHQLTKLGQGALCFTGGFTTTDAGSISLQRGVITLDYKDANALSDYEIIMGWMGNANDPSPGLQLGSGSYVIRKLTNIGSSGQRAMVYGSGTLIIDYSGSTAASTDAGMSGGSASLEKRGSGVQILTGSIDANAITVTQGTLTLGSTGQDIYTAGAVSVLGTLNLQSDANVFSLAGSGTINAAGSLTVRSAAGSTSLQLHMANGSELSILGGRLSGHSLAFDGSGTLSVSLTGGAYLNFSSISASSITLTLLDEELSSLDNGSYALFTHWEQAWGSFISLGEEGVLHVGRKSVTLNTTDGTLTVSSLGEALTWAGGSLTWETSAAGESGWQLSSGGTDRFYSGDSAIFSGAGGQVSIKGRVVADSVSINSADWSFIDSAGTTNSLRLVGDLSVAQAATAAFGNANLSIAGSVQSLGTLSFSGSSLSIEGGVAATGGSLIFSGASAEVAGLMSIGAATAAFSGDSILLSGGLATTSASADVTFSGANATIAGMNLQGGHITFSGTTTTLSAAATIAGGSTVTFSGSNLYATNYLNIGDADSVGTVILNMGQAPNATAANDPSLGTPATGRSLGKVKVEAGSRLVVYGYNGNTNTSYTWKQNTSLSTYTQVVGEGTLEFRDLGYQVLTGESIHSFPDQNNQTSIGSSILFRFIAQKSTESNPETIHIVELSTEDSSHATSLAFDRGDPSNGWNPATAILKRIEEIHVKAGAALGFTGRYLDNDSQTGAQSGAKVFETTHGVLHLAGQGTGTGEINQGSNAALYVNSENSLAVNVSMPWDVVLDAHTSINTYTKNSGITFTGAYDGGSYTLTKLGAGTMTFGESFTTAEGSSGAITASRGNLVFAYEKGEALKNYSINISQFNASEKACLTLQGGAYAIRNLSGDGTVTGSGTLEFTLSTGDSVFSSDIEATEEGDRLSLKMSGAGSQTISGVVTVQDVTVAAGSLTLGSENSAVSVAGETTMNGGRLNLDGATAMGSLAGTIGSIAVASELAIGSVAKGSSLTSIEVAAGARLEVGGGTLQGDTLSFAGSGTLAVSLEGSTYLDFTHIAFNGAVITLELLDLYLPDSVTPDTPYKLFTNWDAAWGEHIEMQAKLGRLDVRFDKATGSIIIENGEHADLLWNGSSGDTWQSTTTLTNWNNTGNNNEADSFYNGDNVTFNSPGSQTIYLKGKVYTGAVHVRQGDLTLEDTAGSDNSFGSSRQLSLASGATLTFNNASTTLRGEVEVGANATLTINSATTVLEQDVAISGALYLNGADTQLKGDFSIAGGSLSLGAGAVSSAGDITVESGSFSIGGAFTSDGKITLGKDGGAANMTVQSSAAKSLGTVEINAGSSLVLYGASGSTNYAGSYTNTAVSGDGALTLRNFGYNELGADGGLLASFLSAEKGIGQLRADRADLSNNDYSTSLAFTAASTKLDSLLTSIGDIYIGTGTAIGFAGNGANAMANSTGTLHLSGTGTGESGLNTNYGTKGGNAALYVAGAIAAKVAWDVVLESNINVTPVAAGSSITLNGSFNAKGYTLTKNGQGAIITGADFNTVEGSTGTLLWARGGIMFGHAAHADAFKNYTLQMGYNAQTATLTLLSGGTYAVDKLTQYNNSTAQRSAITGNGTLEIWSTSASTVYADISAGEGGRVSLAMKGSGTQTISGDIVVGDITIDAGALDLGIAGSSIHAAGTVALNAGQLTLRANATLATFTAGEGSLAADGNLSIEQAEIGSAEPSGNITVGGDLTLGGGTLKGGELSLSGKLTVSLANESHLDFSSIASTGITLELTDTVMPYGYSQDKAYQLFEKWDATAMAGKISFEEVVIGRLTVTFNEQNGALEFSGEVGDLTWLTDGRVSNVWQDSDDTALNWNNASSDSEDYFISGDHVTFSGADGGEVAVHGNILSGNVTIASGSWSFSDHTIDGAEGESYTVAGHLTIGGQLTIASGAAAEFANASTSLANASIEGTLSVSGNGALANTGTLTIDGGSAILSTTGAKTIGHVVVNEGGSLVISGSDTDTSALFSNSFVKNTAEVTYSSVSGSGTLELSGLYRYVGKVYNVISLTDSANLLAAFFPVADSEAGKGKIGALKLTNQSALSIQTASGSMKNILSHIEEIHIAEGSALGFAGSSSAALVGSTGTFYIAGSGTGRGSSDSSGKYGALFVAGEITVSIPWDIVVDAAGATLYTAPGDYGQNIMKLTGALTLDGAKLTKLGNGNLELAEGFTTQAAAGKTTDSGTIILGNENVTSSSLGGGSLTLNYSAEDALAGYVIALNHTGNGSAQLLVYDTSASAESHRFRVKGISDDVTNAVDGKYASQNKRASIGGYGTLIIDTDETMTSQASIVGGIYNSASTATLTLVKEGTGEQKILGNVIAKSISVNKGVLTLGSSGKTVKVNDTLAVQNGATFNSGGHLTVGALTGEGLVAAQEALSLTGDITGFTGTLDASASGAKWTLTGSLSKATTIAAALSGNIEVAYTGSSDVTLTGGASAGSTITHAMTASEKGAEPGALTLEGNYSDVALVFSGTEIRLGSASAAGAWSGSLAGSGTFTLVNGSLAAALTKATLGNVNLAVDAVAAVDVQGTAGALLSRISIREGGSLSGVSGDITVAANGTSMSLILGQGNLGSSGSGLISSTGDLYITDTSAFSIGFSAEALKEVLAANGQHVRLNILSGGGSVNLAEGALLKDILASDYAQLLTSYQFVAAEGGSLVICGDSTHIYLVLADGSRDADAIRDYHALDDRTATVLDEGVTLDIALGDSTERKNTLTINNLVGLKGSTLRLSNTGQDELTIELNNSNNMFVTDDTQLAGSLQPDDVRGLDTEFKGLIESGEGVNLRKIGKGTLYVGEFAKSSSSLSRSAVGEGGLQVEGEVSIHEGAIVVRGEKSEIGRLAFDYAEKSADADEQRGFTASGSSITIHDIAENGAYTEDNNIILEYNGEVIFDGSAELESTQFASGTGGGTLTVAEDAELTLTGEGSGSDRISGIDVQVDGGELTLADGASASDSDFSIVNDGHVQLGKGSGISGGNVDVQSGSLSMSADSEGLHTSGELNIGSDGLVDLGGSSSSVGALNGDGELKGSATSELEIQGNGGVFSGTLSGDSTGGGSLVVADGADFTLKDVQTSADSAWDARVRSNGSLTVDVESTSRETHLGDITLEDNSEFIYKFDTGRSSNLEAHLELENGAHADFVIYSDGASVDPDKDVDLPGLTFTGDADSLQVKLKGKAFVQYHGNAHLKEGENGLAVGIEKVTGNLFLKDGMHKNARAGAIIFWDTFDTQGSAWKHMQENPTGHLAKFTDELYSRYESGQDMSRLLAAGAGASISALGHALQEDVRRQLNTARNRAAAMVDTNKPGELANMWISAETNYLKMNADSLAPGFTLNGWGGSVGADVMLEKGVHVGLSLTAMYNDLKVNAADYARGDMDTVYLTAFSRVMDGEWMHTFIVTGGTVNASLNRTVNYGSGGYSTAGDTNGYTLAALYELGYTMMLSEDGSEALQPLASIQFRHTALKGYSEKGSDAGLRVGDIAANVVTLAIGARYMATLSEDMLSTASTFELRALLKADMGDRSGTAETGLLLGAQRAEVESAKMGAVGLEIGAGLNIPVDGPDGSLFIEAAADFRSNYTNVNAGAGYRLHF